MQTSNLTKTNKSYNWNQNGKLNSNLTQVVIIGIVILTVFLVPEISFAVDGKADAFETILSKTTGWVSGAAGKLITFISLAMAGIMGVAGFPTKYVVGSLGTGLLLSSASGIVDMIF